MAIVDVELVGSRRKKTRKKGVPGKEKGNEEEGTCNTI